MWRNKNQPSNSTSCSDNALSLLVLVAGRADYIEDFKWRLHFEFGVAFWRVVLREVYFESPSHVWRALKTSILNTDAVLLKWEYGNPPFWKECVFFFLREVQKATRFQNYFTSSLDLQYSSIHNMDSWNSWFYSTKRWHLLILANTIDKCKYNHICRQLRTATSSVFSG